MRGFPQIFSGDEMMFTSADLNERHGGGLHNPPTPRGGADS